MDAPRIQYAKTEDGVSIAYWKIGSGPVLILTPQFVTGHLAFEWQMRRGRAFERLAERATVVRYDERGVGLSQRDVLDFSVEAHVRDLEAILDATSSQQVTLLSQGAFAGAPVRYAHEHRDRVARMVLTFGGAMGGAGFAAFREVLKPL